jgi:DNA-binding XRE family transcriptional regulator
MTKQEFRELRLKCGLTQKQLSIELGVSERMIRHKESMGSGYRITLRDKKRIETIYNNLNSKL